MASDGTSVTHIYFPETNMDRKYILLLLGVVEWNMSFFRYGFVTLNMWHTKLLQTGVLTLLDL